MSGSASRVRPSSVLLSILSLVVVGLAAVAGPSAHAADGDLAAHGSARQVYATGLGKGAAVSLLDSHGRVVKRQKANALGGVLFRDRPALPSQPPVFANVGPVEPPFVQTSAAEPVNDVDFLSELEVALERPYTPELVALDALTPHVREVRITRVSR